MNKSAGGLARQRILDAALELFAQHGFAGASLRMLARAIDRRESSIYNHFSSKDELYQAVIAQWGPAEFVERLKSVEYRALADEPTAFFRLCGKHLIERWVNPREQLFVALINKEGPDGVGQKRYYEALFHEENDLLTDYFKHFADAGRIFAPDPRETARMFTAGLSLIRREHLIMAPAPLDRKEIEAAVARYIDNFIELVVREPSRDHDS